MPRASDASTACPFGPLAGPLLIAPDALGRYRDRLRDVDLIALANAADDGAGAGNGAPAAPYELRNGVATVLVSGPTTKHPTLFQRLIGGTSTVAVQRTLRSLRSDPDVRAVLLHFEDAPGGTVAGAMELYQEIRAFAAAKPIRAHATDQCCSAAYLFASAAARLTANATAAVGGVGVRAALYDTSKRYEREGVRPVPLATGKFKAMGMPGLPVTKEHEAELRRHVERVGAIVVDAVAAGRGVTADHVRALEGRTFLAAEAVGHKLVDAVCSFEEARADLERHALNPAAAPTVTTTAASTTTAALPAAWAPTAEDLSRESDMRLLEQLRTMTGAGPTASEDDVLARLRRMLPPPPPSAAQVQAEVAETMEYTSLGRRAAAAAPPPLPRAIPSYELTPPPTLTAAERAEVEETLGMTGLGRRVLAQRDAVASAA
jgi:signal peptide peptidase SppA